MKNLILSAFAIITMAFTTQVYAQKNPMVGGAAMYADKNIVENAVNSADHTTLGGIAAGRKLNLEIDVLARYLKRMTEARQ